MKSFSSPFASSTSFILRAVAVAAVSATCLAANAQQTSALEATCPGASEQLADALDRVAREHRETANVSVSMSVQNQRASGVEIVGADGTYERAVRQALRGLQCNAAAGPAKVSFVLQFAVPPAVASAPFQPAVAMSAKPLPASAASR